MQRPERIEPRHATEAHWLRIAVQHERKPRIGACGLKHQPDTNTAVPAPDRELGRELVVKLDIKVGGGPLRAKGKGRRRVRRIGYRAAALAAPDPEPQPKIDRELFWRVLRARHPRLRVALVEDARVTASHRGERPEFRSGVDAASPRSSGSAG